ncbi:MAG TPA: hypothetical protein EYH31_06545 [Anaerolineae bacterium]|nr:hypothetical protein [Anaerolineae bacterium]
MIRVMDRFARLAIITILVMVWGAFAPAVAIADHGTAAPAADYVPGQFIVKLRADPSHTATSLAASTGAQILRRIDPIGVVVLEANANKSETLAQKLADDPRVEWVEPNFVIQGDMVPNDPDYSNPSKVYAPQRINAEQAWDVTTGDPSVIIAIVDSGVDPTHPEFAGRLLPGYDFVNDDEDPSDDNGHGTHVAGIAAAAINNGIGSVGICGNCSILPIKVLNQNNQGTWADVAAGIVYAADHGADVINLSLGGSIGSQAVHDAIIYATNAGALVVAAAGNDNSDAPHYPAYYPETVAVSATRTDDTKWGGSNYGDYIDVAAPGLTVYSTAWSGDSPSGYTFKTGTSMAAPHVAGLAGLLKAQDPTRTPADLRALIESTAADLGDPGWDPIFGYGRIDAGAALTVGMGAGDETLPGAIAGIAWVDVNGNGFQDGNETMGVPDVPITVKDSSDQIVARALTDQFGYYQVEDLAPGTYTVSAEAPRGYFLTSASAQTVQVESGQLTTDVAFGFAAPTGVELVMATAEVQDNQVVVTWSTQSERGLVGFHVYRALSADGVYKRVTQAPIPAVGTADEGATYRFVDTMASPTQTNYYQIESVSVNGESEWYGPFAATPTAQNLIFMPLLTS